MPGDRRPDAPRFLLFRFHLLEASFGYYRVVVVAAARASLVNITVNGRSRVPPGFRFHPTEEELLSYYLRKKLAGDDIGLDVIRDVDLNKLEPWDLQGMCGIGCASQDDWYFFSHKDKKYPTGSRTNRATAAGFWKATGRDKVVYGGGCRRLGMRKTLVFYRGRAPHGQKSDWIMHEYRLDEQLQEASSSMISGTLSGEGSAPPAEEGCVVCRVFRKKNHVQKSPETPNSSPLPASDVETPTLLSHHDGALDQILEYLGRTYKSQEDVDDTAAAGSMVFNTNNLSRPSEVGDLLNIQQDNFLKLPALECPTLTPLLGHQSCGSPLPGYAADVVNNWAALERLVASHLGVLSPETKQLTSCYEEQGDVATFCPGADGSLLCAGPGDYQQEGMEFWAPSAYSACPPEDHFCGALGATV